MSTLLDRDKSVDAATPLINKYSPYLRDICDFACNLLLRCQSSAREVDGTPFSLLTIYCHAIRMADGIEVLCSQSCFVAAMPLLRSLMEAEYSVEYMLKGYKIRSAAWLADLYLERMRLTEVFDPETEKGRAFKMAHRRDRMRKDVDLGMVDVDSERQIREQLQDILHKPRFARAHAAFRKLAKKKKSRKWYRINNGPDSLRGLAAKIKRELDYEIHYKYYSGVVHAQDTTSMFNSEGDSIGFRPIRSLPPDPENIYVLAGARLLSISLLIAAKFRPQEDVSQQLQRIIRKHRPEAFKKQN